MSTPLVSVVVVCTNDLRHLPRCIDSLRSQQYECLEFIFLDNASTDGSREFLSSFPDIRLILNATNLGFSAAQNRGIAAASGEWILCLNPDTRLEPTFVTELVRAGSLDASIGIVCPKIRRMSADGATSDPPILDSTGCYFTPWLRHHDRGSQQPDLGQYDAPALVIGYTGAAALFRKHMIVDVSIDGEFMDEDFFFYREDADVSWRAQLLGWRCIYTPYAIAYHVRTVFEHNRQHLSPTVNLHSTKNRFLMRIKNITPYIYLRVLIPATLRDLAILAYVVTKERTSLPGLWWIVRNWRRMWAKRRSIQRRARTSSMEMASWFSTEPVAKPLPSFWASQLEAGSRQIGSVAAAAETCPE